MTVAPALPLRLRELLESSRSATLLETLAVVALPIPMLVMSERIGASTLAGGFLGWAGLMLGLLLVVLSLRLRGEGLAELGLGRPRSWPRTLLLGIALAVVLLVGGQLLLTYVVQPLLGGRPVDSSRFDVLRGNLPVFLVALFSVWTSAAFAEEILYRGFLLQRLARILGGGRAAWGASLVLSSLLFGSLHFYQGPSGMAITGILGLLFGSAYLLLGRRLWPLVFAHGLIDTISLASVFLSAKPGS